MKNQITYTPSDPWVWCSKCQALLQVDPMDSSCRLCHEFDVLSQKTGVEVIKILKQEMTAGRMEE